MKTFDQRFGSVVANSQKFRNNRRGKNCGVGWGSIMDDHEWLIAEVRRLRKLEAHPMIKVDASMMDDFIAKHGLTVTVATGYVNKNGAPIPGTNDAPEAGS
jgi:hypothetical protein